MKQLQKQIVSVSAQSQRLIREIEEQPNEEAKQQKKKKGSNNCVDVGLQLLDLTLSALRILSISDNNSIHLDKKSDIDANRNQETVGFDFRCSFSQILGMELAHRFVFLFILFAIRRFRCDDT